MQTFKDCLFNSGSEPMRTVGEKFTWFNKGLQAPVHKRLDRMVAFGSILFLRAVSWLKIEA